MWCTRSWALTDDGGTYISVCCRECLGSNSPCYVGITNASHILNTPLNDISGIVDLYNVALVKRGWLVPSLVVYVLPVVW